MCTNSSEFSLTSFLIYVVFIERTDYAKNGKLFKLSGPTPQSISFAFPPEAVPVLLQNLILSLAEKLSGITASVQSVPSERTSKTSDTVATKFKSNGKFGQERRNYSTSSRQNHKYKVVVPGVCEIYCSSRSELDEVIDRLIREKGINVER